MRFEVGGMTCAHCAAAVRDAIQRVDAEAVVDVDVARQSVDVVSTQPREALATAIRSAGYVAI